MLLFNSQSKTKIVARFRMVEKLHLDSPLQKLRHLKESAISRLFWVSIFVKQKDNFYFINNDFLPLEVQKMKLITGFLICE